MPKPPRSTPSSDIDGVHREEARNTDVAAAQGQSAGSLDRARKRSRGRPGYSDDSKSGDDRSR
jgi:hypothetical protein